jgi:tRNA threonylcarbamoyladenosine biosynthesis protein TsaB
VCGAAVVHDGAVLTQRQEQGKHIHAERLLALVDGVLAGRPPGSLDAIGISIGPGSFTGLRIGLSCGKGLAYAAGIPMVAVPTLEAIATKVVRSGIAYPGDLIVPVLDARRGEVYCQFFRVAGGGVTSEGPPKDIAVDDLRGMLSGAPVLITGEAALRFRYAGAGTGDTMRFAEPSQASCDAGIVGLVAERLFNEGHTEDPASLEPRYIKDFFLRAPATTGR